MVGEIRSLLDNSVKLAVFTATATKSTKVSIFGILNLGTVSTSVVEKSPLKSNLSFFSKYVSNERKFQDIFADIINELRFHGESSERTIIFCQTRSQCALIWKTFKLQLGASFYRDGKEDPTSRLVEMFHAGSPKSVKEHVLSEMRKKESCLRVVVVTTAFGMGIDCKQVSRVIHFGPSKSIEAYLQECGRAGRDGTHSKCYLLYNGFLASQCQHDMKHYVASESCRRKFFQDHFPGKHAEF